MKPRAKTKNPKTAKKAPQSPEAKPMVVGIGASAGGLAALKRFFANVPEDCGLAFVIVVHLSPDHESHLADLLQPHVKMPIEQVMKTIPLIEPRLRHSAERQSQHHRHTSAPLRA